MIFSDLPSPAEASFRIMLTAIAFSQRPALCRALRF
jgi:hypothetical protein